MISSKCDLFQTCETNSSLPVASGKLKPTLMHRICAFTDDKMTVSTLIQIVTYDFQLLFKYFTIHLFTAHMKWKCTITTWTYIFCSLSVAFNYWCGSTLISYICNVGSLGLLSFFIYQGKEVHLTSKLFVFPCLENVILKYHSDMSLYESLFSISTINIHINELPPGHIYIWDFIARSCLALPHVCKGRNGSYPLSTRIGSIWWDKV